MRKKTIKTTFFASSSNDQNEREKGWMISEKMISIDENDKFYPWMEIKGINSHLISYRYYLQFHQKSCFYNEEGETSRVILESFKKTNYSTGKWTKLWIYYLKRSERSTINYEQCPRGKLTLAFKHLDLRYKIFFEFLRPMTIKSLIEKST